MFVDVHCHLDHEDFKKDLDEVIKRAKKANVKKIITNGIDPITNRKTLELTKRFDNVLAALGIYPMSALREEVKEMDYPLKLEKFDVDSEIEFIKKNKDNIIAIGEVGLDFSKVQDKKEQYDVFEKMIKLSEDIKKPIIVHSRKAELDCIETLEGFSNKKVIMHCFSGKFKLVKRIYENGWYLTIPTHVIRSGQIQKIAKEIPMDHLFIETDAPYLSPFRGERNEPAYVIESAKKIAEIKGLDLVEVENLLYLNFQRVFER